MKWFSLGISNGNREYPFISSRTTHLRAGHSPTPSIIESMNGSILRRFEDPDEVRLFEKGRFEIVRIGGLTIGRASYEPGWEWSEHVAPGAGSALCGVEHVGLVISGRAVAAFQDGSVMELTAGHAFPLPALPHDSWVMGDEPYVSLHFIGAEHYTK